MPKFRVGVNLADFFEDERKLIYTLVDPSWSDVRCLQKHVEKLLGLENISFITQEGYYLPEQESIDIIECGDILRAFTATDVLGSKGKRHKRRADESNKQVNEVVTKKRKRKQSPNMELTSSISKRRKQLKTTTPPITANTSIIETENVEQEPPLSESIEMKKNVVSYKKKTKKKKRQKSLSLPNGANESLSRNEKKDSMSTDEIAITRKKGTTFPFHTKHKYFGNDGEIINGGGVENAANVLIEKVIFSCELDGMLLTTPRVFQFERRTSARGTAIRVTTEKKLYPELDTNHNTTVNVQEVIIIKSHTLNNEPSNVYNSVELQQEDLKEKQYQEGLRDKEQEAEQKEKQKEDEEHEPQGQQNDEEPQQHENYLRQTNEKNEESDFVGDWKESIQTIELDAEQKVEIANVVSMEDSNVIAIESDDDENEENDVNEDDTAIVIDLNGNDEDSDQEISQTKGFNIPNRNKKIEKENFSIVAMLPFSTILEELPSPGDIVIFKMQRRDKRISNFIAAKCEYINKENRQLKMHVIDGKSEIDVISPKFHCRSFDSRQAAIFKREYLEINIAEMRDARLFSQS